MTLKEAALVEKARKDFPNLDMKDDQWLELATTGSIMLSPPQSYYHWQEQWAYGAAYAYHLRDIKRIDAVLAQEMIDTARLGRRLHKSKMRRK